MKLKCQYFFRILLEYVLMWDRLDFKDMISLSISGTVTREDLNECIDWDSFK